VIGVFVEIGNTDHEELEKIVKLIDKIKYKNDKVTLSEPLSVDKLMPDSEYALDRASFILSHLISFHHHALLSISMSILSSIPDLRYC